MPRVTSTAPGRSKWRFSTSLRPSGIRRALKRTIAIPIGMLMTKIAGQLKASVRTPPSSTPDVAPIAPTAPQAPSARLRGAPSSKEVVMIARVAGERIAPAVAWGARAATRRPGGGGDGEEKCRPGKDRGAEKNPPPAAEEISRAPAE